MLGRTQTEELCGYINAVEKQDAQHTPGTHIMPHTLLPQLLSPSHFKCLLKQLPCIKEEAVLLIGLLLLSDILN